MKYLSVHEGLSEEDIARIFACSISNVRTVFREKDDRVEIEKQDYILTPGRYVGIEEQEDDGEPFEEKMDRLTSELSEMFAKSHELEDEIRRKLGACLCRNIWYRTPPIYSDTCTS